MLNVLPERKYLLCYKPKDHLPEEKKKNPVSFCIQSAICFKSQNFIYIYIYIYIYIAVVSFQSTGNILQPKWRL